MKTLKFKLFLALFLVSTSGRMSAQDLTVEPPYWWTGMRDHTVELLIYAQHIGDRTPTIHHHGVHIGRVTRTQNTSYLFVELHLSADCQPGVLQLHFIGINDTLIHNYTLKARSEMAQGASGLSPSDLIYLIFPDRFSNGDPSNDVIAGMNDQRLDRSELFHRHGGDLQGIIDRLDYLDDLGITALWINPVIENDQPSESYHGYAATQLYRIDPRFGTDEEYRTLVSEAHRRGMKIIKDIVYNHWGDRHPFYADIPDSSWFNFWPEFTRTTYRATTLFDPYAHPAERQKFSEGWFDHHMPDLNQRNPQLANYLIQHSLWSIGHYGVDAFRIDTYAYPDQLFMRELTQRIRDEFPRFFCFGETWVHGTPTQAWFSERNGTLKGFDSQLQSVTDFQLYYALQDALNQPFGWTEGVSRIYYTLAKDVLYRDASRNVTFLDNHDLSRIYSVLGEDPEKLKMAIGFILTTRGIPSLYYGTEIGLKNFADPDGKVRQDFPGGWSDDLVNKFEASGREADEQRLYTYVRTLARYRREHSALFSGSLVHFVPENGIYVYFREGGGKRLMCVMNPGNATDLDMARFKVAIDGARSGQSILDDSVYEIDGKPLRVSAKQLLLLELH